MGFALNALKMRKERSFSVKILHFSVEVSEREVSYERIIT
jgi:hypothetical protein